MMKTASEILRSHIAPKYYNKIAGDIEIQIIRSMELYADQLKVDAVKRDEKVCDLCGSKIGKDEIFYTICRICT